MQTVENLRNMNLSALCVNAGLRVDKADATQFKAEGFRVRVSGFKWFDHHNGVGGGGAIDLIRHIYKLSFSEASCYLTNEAAVLNKPMSSVPKTIKKRVTTPPRPCPNHLDAITDYLTVKRGLNADLVRWCVSNNLIYADHKQNCVFRYGLTGAELRGTGSIQWRSLYGNIEQGFILPAKQAAGVALVESAIDALSFRQLHKDMITISIAGNSNRKIMQQALMIAITKNIDLIAAFDSDKGGDIANNTLQEIANNYKKKVIQNRPITKDWNDQLKNLNF